MRCDKKTTTEWRKDRECKRECVWIMEEHTHTQLFFLSQSKLNISKAAVGKQVEQKHASK